LKLTGRLMSGLYGSGLKREDWYLLKDAVLGAAIHKGGSGCIWYTKLPDRLKRHEVGQLVYKHLYKKDGSALDKAAKNLVPGADKEWLVLMKA